MRARKHELIMVSVLNMSIMYTYVWVVGMAEHGDRLYVCPHYEMICPII